MCTNISELQKVAKHLIYISHILSAWMHSPSDFFPVVDLGGVEGAMPPSPSPVQISHKKDGRQRRPHRFHVSSPPPTRPLDPILFPVANLLLVFATSTSRNSKAL